MPNRFKIKKISIVIFIVAFSNFVAEWVPVILGTAVMRNPETKLKRNPRTISCEWVLMGYSEINSR
jgi:hypothetical protein